MVILIFLKIIMDSYNFPQIYMAKVAWQIGGDGIWLNRQMFILGKTLSRLIFVQQGLKYVSMKQSVVKMFTDILHNKKTPPKLISGVLNFKK